MKSHLVGQAMGFGGVPSTVELLKIITAYFYAIITVYLSIQEFHYKMKIYNTWRFWDFMNLNRSLIRK